MKRTLAFAVSMFAAVCCMAQETHAIEPSNLEVRYTSYYLGDNAKTYGATANTFVLRCGKTTSQYFCAESYRSDSLGNAPGGLQIRLAEVEAEHERLKAGKGRTAHLPGYGEYYYRDFLSGEVSMYTSTMGEHFRIVDKPDINWNVVSDSVKTILGYECHLATARYHGRDWRVWFTLDIPLSLGPAKLCGLPGLILQADMSGIARIEAFKILTTNLQPITFYNFYKHKFTDIGRVKYIKASGPQAYPKGTLVNPDFETE